LAKWFHQIEDIAPAFAKQFPYLTAYKWYEMYLITERIPFSGELCDMRQDAV
jgi:hypothetical protein